jgi:DNA replication protein DnaC
MTATAEKLEDLLQQAQKEQLTYLEWLLLITKSEIENRQTKALGRRLKQARLPIHHELDDFDFTHQSSMSPQQLKQLRELLWMEQNYNLILMGPSGVGKTYLAAGLAYDAIQAGYTALFRTMQQIIDTLKLKDMTRSAKAEYQRICKAHLIIIDDMMMFPVEKADATRLFHLINHLHEQSSIIITTNKSPKQWAEMLQDEVLATAMLDRLLYRCEVISLQGQSYRMANRKTIFEQETSKTD